MSLNRRRLLLGSLSSAALFAAPARAATPKRQGLDAAQFGVRPNAPDDQSQRLQRAIDRAAQAGAPLLLAPGLYRAGGLTLRAGSQLAGIRGATRIALTHGPSLLSAEGADAITLTGLTLEGGNLPLARDGGLVNFTAARDVRIADCTITNANGNAIRLFHSTGAATGNAISGSADNAIYCLDSKFELRANTIAKSGNGGIRVWQSVKRSDGSVVDGNTIEDTDARAGGSGQNGNAINVYRAADVIVRGNTIRRAAFSAVRGNAASNFQVIGNNCAGFGETAMYAEFDYENATFLDNIIDDAANGISVTNFDVGGHGGRVAGNQVRNIGQRVLATLTEGAGNGFGISIEADVTATSNIVENCAYAGLKLGFGPYLRNVTASANTIRRSPYGIAVSVVPGAGRAAIIDNRVEGATRGAIVGMEWHKAVTGDLAIGGAERYPQLRVSGNKAN